MRKYVDFDARGADNVLMHIISRKALVVFWTKYGDAKEQLAAWFKTAESATWATWADVHKAYPKASYYECCLIFNIVGGSYRLVVRRAKNWKTLFVVGVYTHRDYDRDEWKKSCECR
jgi:mRNA-degrading endonuclease HigB of HigAB toxin-antitoxin module